MTNFNRLARVFVRLSNETLDGYKGDLTLSNLRISFSIQKNLAWSTNTAQVRVWNLSGDKRNILRDYGDQVTLYAGYEFGGGEQILFIGDTVSVQHIFDLPEIVTVLECGDGDKYANQKTVSVSFQKGATARDVINEIARQMGITVLKFDSDNLIYKEGFSSVDMGKDALDKACRYLGLEASIQNNNLQIIPQGGTLDQTPFIINADTGMIGIPQRYTFKRSDLYRKRADVSHTQIGYPTGWKVQTTLRPDIFPGAKVQIQSTHIDLKGIFRVETIRHEGDTYGPIWRSNLEVTLIK
jgi:hypothetical protein